jgi:LPS sulfotransferase NodH
MSITASRNPVRFVMLFMGRSGSTYLVDALASHPEICAKWEGLLGRKDADAQLERARRFFTQPPDGEYPAVVGFKTKLSQVKDCERFAKFLGEMGARIILLQRRNTVKHVVSWVNSERIHDATGYWNLWNEENRLPPTTIDVAKFDRKLEQVEKGKRALESYAKKSELPTLWSYYEDLLVDKQATLQRIFSFLGVRSEPVQGGSIKNTSDDLREAVSNFDELRAHYVGTPYEQMFDEVLVSAQC